MLVKIATIFLAFMAVLAMFGRLKLPKLPDNKITRRLGGAKCPDCGRHRMGKGPCDCGRR
jgi:hypothetical protein